MPLRPSEPCVVRVALDLPLHRLFDYRFPDDQQVSVADVGCRVRVPIGQRQTIGIIVAVDVASEVARGELKPVLEVLRDQYPLPGAWLRLTSFCASYYHAPLGQVMLATLPARLRALAPARTLAGRKPVQRRPAAPPPQLTAEQQMVLGSILADGMGFHAYLLHGVTGSGKTEVYLRLIERALAAGRQALVLVPEINLTPQLEARVAERFPTARLVSLHSDLAEAARSRNWLAGCSGEARIVLGTRLAVFAPLPELGLIIVDEEHDSSFKQQDGVRYSARDLAVFRARDSGIPVILGSATPSLESWANATGDGGRGRYRLLSLRQRAVEGSRLPLVRIIDTRLEKPQDGLSGTLLLAIEQCLCRGEQSLIFL
ncbi:MAG TPA: primosomal protein N', partial [Accumulibacter sp.]|uniref:replication restart helicase PriA n=1 Tax=Accumulibacter sp. TaxID=2053492 RepID=UPI002C3A2960